MTIYKVKEKAYCKKYDTNDKKIKLQFLKDFDGTYSLSVFCYDRCLSIGDLCESVKRLSTINKYAKEYGVQFEA